MKDSTYLKVFVGAILAVLSLTAILFGIGGVVLISAGWNIAGWWLILTAVATEVGSWSLLLAAIRTLREMREDGEES